MAGRRRSVVEVEIKAKDQASKPIKAVEGRFKRLGTSIKSSALAITAAIAGIVVAFRQISESAKQIGQEKALERNLAAQGKAINEFIGELKRLSDNQIATADLVLASNRALALGIAADDLPGLMTVAANAAVELGISTTQAFNDITTGIGRASPLILDNLGIVVDATKVYAAFAASIGTSVEALTKQQKTAALSQAVMKGATTAIEDFSSRQDALTRNINRGNAAFENFKNVAGRLGGGLVSLSAGGISLTLEGIVLLSEGVIKLGRGFLFLLQLLPGVGSFFEGFAKTLKDLDDSIDGTQESLQQFTKDLLSGGVATIKAAIGIGENTKALKLNSGALVTNTGKQKENTESKEDAKDAEEDATQATIKLTEAKRINTTELERNTQAARANAAAVGGTIDPSRVGTTGLQFAGGKFVFINGRRAQVFPDGRVVYP